MARDKAQSPYTNRNQKAEVRKALEALNGLSIRGRQEVLWAYEKTLRLLTRDIHSKADQRARDYLEEVINAIKARLRQP